MRHPPTILHGTAHGNEQRFSSEGEMSTANQDLLKIRGPYSAKSPSELTSGLRNKGWTIDEGAILKMGNFMVLSDHVYIEEAPTGILLYTEVPHWYVLNFQNIFTKEKTQLAKRTKIVQPK